MAAEPALSAFLALTDDTIAAYADARARALGLTLPDAVRAGVVDNLILLRAQTANFLSGLPAEAPQAEAFEP